MLFLDDSTPSLIVQRLFNRCLFTTRQFPSNIFDLICVHSANNIIFVHIGHLRFVLLDLRIQSFCFESSGFESKDIFRGAIYKQRVVIRQAQSLKVG